jgi:predicted transcriptional regulator
LQGDLQLAVFSVASVSPQFLNLMGNTSFNSERSSSCALLQKEGPDDGSAHFLVAFKHPREWSCVMPEKKDEEHNPKEVPMSLGTKKLQILAILSDNLKNPQPQLVRSTDIAGKLNISIKEIQQLLKVMDGMGVIKSNVEGQLSLITRKGVQYLNQSGTVCGKGLESAL